MCKWLEKTLINDAYAKKNTIANFFAHPNEEEKKDGEDHEEDAEYVEEEISQFHSEKVSIASRVGKYQQTITNIDRYARRPKFLEKMCLAQFVSLYTSTSKVPKSVEWDPRKEYSKNKFSKFTVHSTKSSVPKYIKLNGLSGFMRCKVIPSVVRTHASNKKEGSEKFYAEIFLWSSWRNEEEEIKKDLEECKQIYNERLDEIQINRSKIYPHEEAMNLLDFDRDLEEVRPTHIFDHLDPQGEQNNEEVRLQGIEDDETFVGRDLIFESNLKDGQILEESKYPKIDLPENIEDMIEMTKKLAPEQKRPLKYAVKFCYDMLLAEKNPEFDMEPLRLIIHGGAGKFMSNAHNKIYIFKIFVHMFTFFVHICTFFVLICTFFVPICTFFVPIGTFLYL